MLRPSLPLRETPAQAQEEIIEAALNQNAAALTRILKDWSIDVPCEYKSGEAKISEFTPAIYALALQEKHDAVQFLLKYGADEAHAIEAYAFINDGVRLKSLMPQLETDRDESHIRAAVFGFAKSGNNARLSKFATERHTFGLEHRELLFQQTILDAYADCGETKTVADFIEKNKKLPKPVPINFNSLARHFALAKKPVAAIAMIAEGASESAVIEAFALVGEEKRVQRMLDRQQIPDEKEKLIVAAIRGYAYADRPQMQTLLAAVPQKPEHLEAAIESYVSAGNFLQARELLSQHPDAKYFRCAEKALRENFTDYVPLLSKYNELMLFTGVKEANALNRALVEWMLHRDQEHNAKLNQALLDAQLALQFHQKAQNILNEIIDKIDVVRPKIFPAFDFSRHLPVGLERVFYIAMLGRQPAPCGQVELDVQVKAAAEKNDARSVEKLLARGASRDAALYGYARAGQTAKVDALVEGANRIVAIAAYASADKRAAMEKHLFYAYPPSAVSWHAAIYGAACGGQDGLLIHLLNYKPPGIDFNTTPGSLVNAYYAAILGDLPSDQKRIDGRIQDCLQSLRPNNAFRHSLERSTIQARILSGKEPKESKDNSPLASQVAAHSYAVLGKKQEVEARLADKLDPLVAIYGYALMGHTTQANDLLRRHPGDPALRHAALTAYKNGVYTELFRSINALESYRHFQGGPTLERKGKAAAALAQNMRNNLEDFLLATEPTKKTEAGLRLTRVLQRGRREMANDRDIEDYLAHIALALTVVGLVFVLIPHRLLTSSWLLNSTKRQKMLSAVEKQMKRVDVQQEVKQDHKITIKKPSI